MKISQNAIIAEIGFIGYSAYGSKVNDTQNLILLVPSGVNQFGESIGKDEFSKYELFGKSVKEIDLLNKFKVGDKVTVEGYLNSQNYKLETANPYNYKI